MLNRPPNTKPISSLGGHKNTHDPTTNLTFSFSVRAMPLSTSISATTIKLTRSPLQQVTWKYNYDEEKEKSASSLSCANLHASNDGVIKKFLIEDATYVTAAEVISLCPYATQLESLHIEKFYLTINELSPLLIAPLGKMSLVELTLGLGSEDLNGLLGTISSCCPSLKSLTIYKEDETLANNLFASSGNIECEGGSYAEHRWTVSSSNFALLSTSCRNLRRICLEQITVTADCDDDGSGKSDDEPRFDRLEGLVLLRCRFDRSFFKYFSTSEHLAYVELVRSDNFDENNLSEGDIDIGEILDCLAQATTLAASKSSSLLSLSLSNYSVTNHSIKFLAKFFPAMKRLSIGDAPLQVTSGEDLRKLAELQRLDLINFDYNDGNCDDDSLFDDAAISELCGSNVTEASLVNLPGVSPLSVGTNLTKLTDLLIRDCKLFEDCGAVCRLCRINEDLVIRQIENDADLSQGLFYESFFDCSEVVNVDGEEEEEEEEEEVKVEKPGEDV